jgi:hypothetical protein
MYVSRSLVDPGQHEIVLDGIVTAARRRNEQLDVTGCLIFVLTEEMQTKPTTSRAPEPINALLQLMENFSSQHDHIPPILH